MRKNITQIMGIALLCFNTHSYAQKNITENFSAKANVVGSCTLTLPSLIDFGEVMAEVVNSSVVRREAPFTAKCSKGIVYSITKNTPSGYDSIKSIQNPNNVIPIYIDGRKSNSLATKDTSYDIPDGPFSGKNSLIGTSQEETLYISAALVFYTFPKADKYSGNFTFNINF